jgi:hypothetical protein
MRNPYDYSASSSMAYVPALAIKLFRDGMYSGNICGTSPLENQNTTNFFQRNFSNHLKENEGTVSKLGGLFQG